MFPFQAIELWQDGEDSELNISVKLYAKKATHMVRSIRTLTFMFSPVRKSGGTQTKLLRMKYMFDLWQSQERRTWKSFPPPAASEGF